MKKELKGLGLSDPCYCDAAVKIIRRGGYEWEKICNAQKLTTQPPAGSCYGAECVLFPVHLQSTVHVLAVRMCVAQC